MDEESAVERALAAHLGETAERTASLRATAARELVLAAQRAHALGWSQRRIGRALGRSQPEVARLLKTDPPKIDLTYGSPGERALLGVVLRDHRDAIVEAAARRGVRNVRIFGSVARGEETSTSDVDLLVDLDPGTGLFALGALEAELEGLLGREVDIVVARAVRDEVASTIESIPL
ncbi:nucleotidyltransferase family protein [Antribacter gilvus]|uniref:nucleotidyltransferase family protein n=1 Tax=Antribacter gilvus TaxID=2304675 RepID=UPI000F7ACE95|nr:nucleotidyltransferase family protein [Antribacter gilvus]